jgi:tetratricopeptide (TPR) repeat protein
MRRFVVFPVFYAVVALLFSGIPLRAAAPPSQQDGPQKPAPQDQKQQDQKQEDQKQADSKPQPDKQAGNSDSSSSSSSAVQELEQPDQGQKYDPLPAEKDVEVGAFYMHKGDYDAAISRFEDAIQLKTDYAKPRLLLAQTYEKKHDKINAAKYYKEYLAVYPHAPDAKKIQEKIEKLTER